MTVNSALLTAEGFNAEAFSRKYANPVRNGLEVSGFFNDSLAKVANNFAPGKPNFILRGTPTLNGSVSARFTGLSNYLQTHWKESVAATFMCVCSTPETVTLPAFFGTSTGLPALQDTATTTFGYQMRITTFGAMRLNVGYGTSISDDVQSSIAATVSNHATMALFVCEVPGDGGLSKITDITTGATATDGAQAARFPTVNRLRIGSSFVTNTGRTDQMLFRGWSRALTPTEIEDEIADIQAYCLGRGVTV